MIKIETIERMAEFEVYDTSNRFRIRFACNIARITKFEHRLHFGWNFCADFKIRKIKKLEKWKKSNDLVGNRKQRFIDNDNHNVVHLMWDQFFSVAHCSRKYSCTNVICSQHVPYRFNMYAKMVIPFNYNRMNK